MQGPPRSMAAINRAYRLHQGEVFLILLLITLERLIGHDCVSAIVHIGASPESPLDRVSVPPKTFILANFSADSST